MSRFEECRAFMLKQMENDPFSSFLGIEYMVFEENHIRARIPYKRELANPYGTVHGGVLYSVADIVTGVLACSQGKACTTANGSLNYLSPAGKTEYVYFDASILKAGQTLVVVRIEVTNDGGKLLDEGSFTMFKTQMDIPAIENI